MNVRGDKNSESVEQSSASGATLKGRTKPLPLRERVAALQDRIMAHPATGGAADKQFYDALNGDDFPNIDISDVGRMSEA